MNDDMSRCEPAAPGPGSDAATTTGTTTDTTAAATAATTAVPTANGTADPVRGPRASDADARAARVLIVEGLSELRSLLVERFEREGFEVDAREDAAGGLAAALERIPRLVVVNEKIVDERGVPLATRLRDHPDTTRTPLIVLTARAGSAASEALDASAASPDAEAALRRTAQLALPFRPQELIELAREAL